MEDQVGRFDWKQKNVCKALHIEYYPDCILSMLIISASNAVTGLDDDNDVICRRHVLEWVTWGTYTCLTTVNTAPVSPLSWSTMTGTRMSTFNMETLVEQSMRCQKIRSWFNLPHGRANQCLESIVIVSVYLDTWQRCCSTYQWPQLSSMDEQWDKLRLLWPGPTVLVGQHRGWRGQVRMVQSGGRHLAKVIWPAQGHLRSMTYVSHLNHCLCSSVQHGSTHSSSVLRKQRRHYRRPGWRDVRHVTWTTATLLWASSLTTWCHLQTGNGKKVKIRIKVEGVNSRVHGV